MRLIISITCLAICLAVVASKRCDSADDCDGEGECCAVTTRDLSRKGRCLKLGRNKARCNKPEAQLDYYGGKFSSYCPCQEGLECDTGKVENGIGRCKSTATSTAKPDEPEEKPEEPEDKPEEPEDKPEEPEDKPEEPEDKPEEPEEQPEEPEVNPEEPEA